MELDSARSPITNRSSTELGDIAGAHNDHDYTQNIVFSRYVIVDPISQRHKRNQVVLIKMPLNLVPQFDWPMTPVDKQSMVLSIDRITSLNGDSGKQKRAQEN